MIKVILNALLKLISILPLPMVQGLGRFIGFVFGRLMRHHRTDAFEALERSLPDLSPSARARVINAMYRYQGINFVEMIWYSFKGLERVDQVVEVDGMENYELALERGKGVLILTAHVGNFEMVPMAAAANGLKLSVIVKRIKNDQVNEVIEKLRNHKGVTFLATKNTYRDCLKALRRNEGVGMVIDQNMTREGRGVC